MKYYSRLGKDLRAAVGRLGDDLTLRNARVAEAERAGDLCVLGTEGDGAEKGQMAMDAGTDAVDTARGAERCGWIFIAISGNPWIATE